jgi:hypothetical protein
MSTNEITEPSTSAIKAACKIIIELGDIDGPPDYSDTSAIARIIDQECPPQRWKPIETSPRDGTRILLYGTPARTTIGYYDPDLEEWSRIFKFKWEPTHWQPLPPPPAAMSATEKQG